MQINDFGALDIASNGSKSREDTNHISVDQFCRYIVRMRCNGSCSISSNSRDLLLEDCRITK